MTQVKIIITADLPEATASKSPEDLKRELQTALISRFHVVQRMALVQAASLREMGEKLPVTAVSDPRHWAETKEAMVKSSEHDRALAEAFQRAALEVEVLPDNTEVSNEQGAQTAEQTPGQERTVPGT